MSGSAIFNLPTVHLLAGDEGSAFNLPVRTLLAGNNGAIFSLPVLSLEAAGYQRLTVAEFSLPGITLSAIGKTGHIGAAEFRLPFLTLVARGANGSAFDLPFLTLSAIGQTGDIGTAEFRLPVRTLSAAGYQTRQYSAVFDLPFLTLSASGLTGDTGTATFNLLVRRLTAQGQTGEIATATFDLPVRTLSSAGHPLSVGSAAFNLPVVILDARGGVTLAENYRTWVLNTRKGITTEYDWDLVGYAVFNGQVLAVNSAGVVVLGTQGLDGVTEIDARVRVANSDFDTRYLKRVPRIYSGLQQDGDMIFRTITSEGGTRSYRLPWLNVVGYTQRRVPVGKGPKARFWQFEWANENGSDFSIKDLLAYPNVIGRPVQ